MTASLQEIPVATCRASPTARPVLPIKVAELAKSIQEIGLRQPISVRPLPAGAFEIRGGGHRHAAFVELGRETIPAFVRDDDDLHAELAEIDENLVRNDLGPAERAGAIARRKAIYEALHPETAHGGDRRSSRQLGDLKSKEPERFTKQTADATGASERSVQRDANRGEKISPLMLKRIAGTSLDKGEELDALVKIDELSGGKALQIVDRAEAGEKVSAKAELKKLQRTEREADLGQKQTALPDKRYGVILADPEWRFEPYSRETGMDRAADNHYPTSTTDVIASRPVASIAADDCVLFLWATVPMLPDALKVMEAWGFGYRSHAVWGKDRVGTGYWFRNNHELLLVGTRGNVPAPAPGTQWHSLNGGGVREHSRKPDWQYDIVEAYFPSLPKIELNARARREGWDAWGLEAPETIDPDTGEIFDAEKDVEIVEVAETTVGFVAFDKDQSSSPGGSHVDDRATIAAGSDTQPEPAAAPSNVIETEMPVEPSRVAADMAPAEGESKAPPPMSNVIENPREIPFGDEEDRYAGLEVPGFLARTE